MAAVFSDRYECLSYTAVTAVWLWLSKRPMTNWENPIFVISVPNVRLRSCALKSATFECSRTIVAARRDDIDDRAHEGVTGVVKARPFVTKDDNSCGSNADLDRAQRGVVKAPLQVQLGGKLFIC